MYSSPGKRTLTQELFAVLVKPSQLAGRHTNRRSGTCDCASFQSWCQDTSHAVTSKPTSPHLLEPPSNQKRALRGAGEVLVGLAQLDAGVRLGLHIIDVAASLRLWGKVGRVSGVSGGVCACMLRGVWLQRATSLPPPCCWCFCQAGFPTSSLACVSDCWLHNSSRRAAKPAAAGNTPCQ